MAINHNKDLEYIGKLLAILNKIKDCKTIKQFIEILNESQNKLAVIDQYYELMSGKEE